MNKIKVLIIDDSAVIRTIVRELLLTDPQIDVVGEAEEPYQARELIKKLNPDVLTLDIEMPRMDGITFLKNLMRLRPMPVVMLSTLTTKGADVTFEALDIGAVDFIAKPKMANLVSHKNNFRDLLLAKIKSAYFVEQKNFKLNQSFETQGATVIPFKGCARSNHIIAVGASTGGTEAIKHVVTQLPANSPPVVITQHIPPTFSLRFAMRLNTLSQVEVCEARHGQKIKNGHVYIAPGDRHLKVEAKSGQLFCILEDSPLVNRHKPAVDVLFESLVPLADNVQAVLLTGMGSDGALGMKKLKLSGARTLIQDEQSSLIWGMPGSAAKENAHVLELPLNEIAQEILSFAQLRKK